MVMPRILGRPRLSLTAANVAPTSIAFHLALVFESRSVRPTTKEIHRG